MVAYDGDHAGDHAVVAVVIAAMAAAFQFRRADCLGAQGGEGILASAPSAALLALGFQGVGADGAECTLHHHRHANRCADGTDDVDGHPALYGLTPFDDVDGPSPRPPFLVEGDVDADLAQEARRPAQHDLTVPADYWAGVST